MWFKTILVSFFCLFTLGLEAAPVDFPPPFTAQYTIYAKGIPIGHWTRQLTAVDNQTFKVESIGKTNKFVGMIIDLQIEESTLFTRSQHGQIRPLKYSYQQTGSKQRQEVIEFDWNQKVAQARYQDKNRTIALTEDTFDKLLYQVILMQELQQGQRTLRYRVIDKTKVRVYKPNLLGEEAVHTGLGQLNTLKYQRVSSNGKYRTTLWCAPKLRYLPVQVEHVDKGDVFKMILESVEGLGPQKASLSQ